MEIKGIGEGYPLMVGKSELYVFADLMIAANDSAFRQAPPTKAPSISS
jgi:hypothetical protein